MSGTAWLTKLSAGQRIGLLAAVLAVFYLVVAATAPPLAFWSSDSEIKFLQLQNLRWEGGPRIDLHLPGRPLDPNLVAVPLGHAFYEIRDGRVFLVWSIVFPLLSLPFYRLLGPVGLFVIPALSGAGIAYVTGRIAERLRPHTGIAATALVGIATPIFLYSVAFWEHTLAVFCSTWGIYKVVSADGGRARVLGGVTIGFAAGTLRADLYPLVGAFVAVTLLLDWRRAVALIGGLGLASAPSWGVNMLLHGHLLPLNAAKNFTHFSFEYLHGARWRVFADLLIGRGPAPALVEAFCVLAVVAVVLMRVAFRSRVVRSWALPLILMSLGFLALEITRSLLALEPAPASFHGFLAITPVLVAGVAFRSSAAAEAMMGRMLALTSVLYAALYAVAICLATPLGPAGGFLEWGPRFFLPIYPLGLALAVAAFPSWLEGSRGISRAMPVIAFAALTMVGVRQEMTGLGVLGAQARRRQAMRETLSASTEPVISDVWWALMTPTGAAGAEKPMFFGWNFEMIRDLFHAARIRGMTEITVVSFFDYDRHPILQRMKAEGMPIRLEISEKSALDLYVMRIHVDALPPPP